MQRIGTDVSLKTCREEGYLTVLCTNADLKRFDPEKYFTFGKTLPDYMDSSLTKKYYTGSHSAKTIWELYESKKAGIDSCMGLEHEFPTSVHELLSVADSVDAYMGEVIYDYGQ